MQRMRVLRSRHAIAKQARVVGEASVSLDNRLRRARRIEHAVHGEFDPVKAGAPDHLSHIRKHDHVPAPIGQPNRLDARPEETGVKIAEPDNRSLSVAEITSLEHDVGGSALFRLQSFLPAPANCGCERH